MIPKPRSAIRPGDAVGRHLAQAVHFTDQAGTGPLQPAREDVVDALTQIRHLAKEMIQMATGVTTPGRSALQTSMNPASTSTGKRPSPARPQRSARSTTPSRMGTATPVSTRTRACAERGDAAAQSARYALSDRW
jgi:hypothetical protein